ncbi:MAG: hypothetical protein M1830_005352 [Pleopsidium flavum]|nr:MAG: hypothetical protein M1830_005352 [Pleopsidium flavum]
MAEESPFPGSHPSGLMVTSGQVQQLISTNEALLKTNESLKEMVISVVELLKDPTRHATYAAPSNISMSEADDNPNGKASPTLPSENTPARSSAPSSRRTSQGLLANTNSQFIAQEGENCASQVEEVCPMTSQELEEEDAIYRQKYEDIWENANTYTGTWSESGGLGEADPWRQHWVRAREVLTTHFLCSNSAAEPLMRLWKTRHGSFIESAALIGYGEGQAHLRELSGGDITIPLEDLSDVDVGYMFRVTGLLWHEIKLSTRKSSAGIPRAPVVLDDLYQALYYQFIRNARGPMSRYHIETLLSPIVLKVLIRIRFIKSKRPQRLHAVLRGVVIVGRCLQRRLYHPEDGSPPLPWTLRRLRAACYRRRLFDYPFLEGGVNIERAAVEDRVTRNIKWLYRVVCATNMWDKFESLTSDEATEWAAQNLDTPVHELFKRCSDKVNGARLFTRADGPSFPSRDINVRTLRELGGLELRWTDNYADHLKLSSTSQGKRLYIFWNRTPYDLNNLAYYHTHSHQTDELSRTYALIFGPSSSAARKAGKKLAEFSPSTNTTSLNASTSQSRSPYTAVMTFRQPNGSVEWRDVHLLRDPAKSILEAYMAFPVPPEEECIFGGYFFYPFADESKTAPKIGGIIKWGQPSSSSVLLHIEGILRNCYRLEEYEDFDTYPVFQDRLRELKAFMDSRRPSGFLALWKDKRDTLQWYTFWAVLVVGSLSIFLAFASLAVSTAQAVAAFRQLDQAVVPIAPH